MCACACVCVREREREKGEDSDDTKKHCYICDDIVGKKYCV